MHNIIFLNQMKNQFNKYFIGLIFVLFIIFIPNHKASADVVLSCLNWETYTMSPDCADPNSPDCRPSDPYTVCNNWNPLSLYVSLDSGTYYKGNPIKASASATFINTNGGYVNAPGTDLNEVVVNAGTNGVNHTLINQLINKTDSSISTVKSIFNSDMNLYYKVLSGGASYTAPSNVGNYSLTYSATSRNVTSNTNTCTGGYWCEPTNSSCSVWTTRQWICTQWDTPLVYGVTNKTVSGSVGYNVRDNLSLSVSASPTKVNNGETTVLSWLTAGATSCYCYDSNGNNCFAGYAGSTINGSLPPMTMNETKTFHIVCTDESLVPQGSYYQLSMNGGPHPWDNTRANSGSLTLNPVNSAGSPVSGMNTQWRVDELGRMDGQEDLELYTGGMGFDHFVDPITGKNVTWTAVQ